MEESLGIVIPVYQPDTQLLVSYLRDIQYVINPDEIRLEWDEPNKADIKKVKEKAYITSINISSKRRGKGAAITDGFNSLQSKNLVFADCDGSTPANQLNKIIKELERETDLAVGSRRHPKSTIIRHHSILQKYLGDIFARLARQTIEPQLYDYQCGAKAIKKDTWLYVSPYLGSNGFSWDLELITETYSKGEKVEEVPIKWKDNPDSTVPLLLTVSEMAHALVSQIWDNRI